jgi:hypothetical protein
VLDITLQNNHSTEFHMLKTPGNDKNILKSYSNTLLNTTTKGRISILAHGSKWTHYQKTYFKMSKKLEFFFACTSGHTMFTHKFSERKNIFCVPHKKKNLCMNIWLFTGHIFDFLSMPHKMFFFVKNLCGDIKSSDLHAEFFFEFFWHFEICIFYNRFI